MSFAIYRDLLRRKGIPSIVLVGMIAKLPHAAMGLVITMHVRQTLDRSYFEAGIVTMAFTLGIFFGAPWRGRLVDQRGLRRALIPAVTVETLAWATSAFVPYYALIGLAFLGGLFMTPVFSLVRQSLAVLVPPDQRQTAFALDAVFTELMFMFGPLVATVLVTTLPTPVALLIVAGVTVIAGLAFIWLNPPTRSTQLAEPEGLARIESDSPHRPETAAIEPPARGPLFTFPLLAVLAANTAVAFVLSGTDLSVVATMLEWDAKSMTGLVMMVWAFGSMIGGFFYGAANRSWHPLWLVLALSIATLPLGLAPNIVTLCACVWVAGLLCAPSMTAMSAKISDIVPEHRRGEAMGWNGSASTLGSTLGSPIVGAMIDVQGASGGFFVAAGVGVVLAGIGLVLYHRKAGGAGGPAMAS